MFSNTISFKEALEDILCAYPVNEKLIIILKDQLFGSTSWSLEKLYEALLTADRLVL